MIESEVLDLPISKCDSELFNSQKANYLSPDGIALYVHIYLKY